MTFNVRPTFYHRRWARAVLRTALLLAPLALATFSPADVRAEQPSADRGWLGIAMDEQAGGQVLIKNVMRGSPAEKARLQPGDRLLRINGTQVASARETAQAVGRHRAGATIRVTVLRQGKQIVVPVLLEAYPSGEQLLRMQLVGRRAPALRDLRTSVGTRGPTWEDYRGKVVVLDFWASWCVACRVTANHMNRWHDRFASQDLAVLGIAAEPSEEMAQGARRFGLRYPTCADPTMATSAAFSVHVLPSLIVVDRHGMVRDVTTGYDPQRLRQIEALVQRLLAEPAPSKPAK